MKSAISDCLRIFGKRLLFVSLFFLSLPVPLFAETDANKLVDAVLAAKPLQPFLHQDTPGRVPLVLSSSNLPDGISPLMKFGHPVEIFPRSVIAQKDIEAFLEFTKFQYREREANIVLIYPIEGLRFEARFKKKDDDWRLEKFAISEN